MRKGFQSVFVLLSVAMLVSGCDFFRVLAGRPTSKEIAAKREEILRSAQDDRTPVEPRMTDEKPGISDEKPEMTSDSAVPADTSTSSATKTKEKKRYYVIMGAFSSRENAEKYGERIQSFGYEPEFFGFTEGRTAVGIGGTDDLEEAKIFMRELKGQDFCPDGVWILDRKRK
jgi:cell division protein FtsN